MAAPGLFSCDDFSHDCKELCLTTCTVNKTAVGGPLINCFGEVIGVNFISCPFNTFLPINIAFKCLEDLKNNRQVPRPWLGVYISNLYTAKLEKLEELTQKFPHVVKGVIIEKVENTRIQKRTKLKFQKGIRTRATKMKVKQESPASLAGLCADDIIISCDGTSVGSHLELIEALWNKEGKSVELVVVRPRTGQQNLTVTISTSPKMNKWVIPYTGYLETHENRLAIERMDKMKVEETN